MAKYQSDYTGAQIEALLDKINANDALLWTNSSVTANFAAQTIAESSLAYPLSYYRFVDVVFRRTGSLGYESVRRIPVDRATDEAMPNGSNAFCLRFVYPHAGEGILFGDGYNNGTLNNSFIIPVKIYGII